MKKYKLGEICKIYGRIGFRGYTTKDLVEKEDDGAITLSPTNIIDGELDYSNNTYLNWNKYYESPEIILEENNIVLVKTGSSLGKTALVRKLFHPTTLNPQFVVLKDIKANPVYFSYLIKSDYFQKNIAAIKVRSAIPTLSQEDLGSIKIFLPNREIQNKIGTILSAFDNKIALNRRMNAKLEAMAKQLYDYWFVQFDFPNENGKPYKASGGKMEYNEVLKREIPAGWEVKKLGSLFTTNRGVSYSTKTITGDKGIPMINLASFSPDGSYKIDGIKTYTGEYTNEKVLKPFDLVMCNTQQTAIDFSKDIIGKALLVPDIFDGDITSSHHVNTLKVQNEKLKFYLYRLFNTDYFHAYISHFASGTNIMGLDFAGVENYSAVIPSKEVLSKFADFTLNIEKKKSEIIRENKKLISLRDRLLPLLMNGQVEVR
ncbi:MAG: restriction endonuclease subunit S [Treponema sp.]|nr:restriction endonuclease subunit S [Treponema sp.]